MVEDGIPQTLVETLDLANPELYRGIYVAVKTLLTYPVSTCVAEQSFSSMKRLKSPLRPERYVGCEVDLSARDTCAKT